MIRLHLESLADFALVEGVDLLGLASDAGVEAVFFAAHGDVPREAWCHFDF